MIRRICFQVAFLFGASSCLNPGVLGNTISWMPIGNAGNPGDTSVRIDRTSGYGSVPYNFSMSQTQVTNSQYAEFLNSVARDSDPHRLYHAGMKWQPVGGIVRSGESGGFTYEIKPNMANKPVNFVDVYDAMRYVNWFQNGQSDDPASTEVGSYTLSESAIAEHTIVRNDVAGVFLPTEDEWYKAAFYEPGASQNGYWAYPTRSDELPAVAEHDETGNLVPAKNVANYGRGRVASVGSAGPESASYYGVRDMAGSLWDWTETIIRDYPNPPASNPPSNGAWRAIMGGSHSAQERHLHASFRHPEDPFDGDCCRGIRLVLVPEPASRSLIFFAACALVLIRRSGFRCIDGKTIRR